MGRGNELVQKRARRIPREMHYVGHNLNQIAQKAHVLNVVDAKRYDEDSKRLDKLIREVTAAVVLPAKRE